MDADHIEVEEEIISVNTRVAEMDDCCVMQQSWPNGEGATISITGRGTITPVNIELNWQQVEMLKAVLK